MVSKIKKKSARKRVSPKKKEVEIPVLVVRKKENKAVGAAVVQENYFPAEERIPEKYQILKNDNDLPVFEKNNFVSEESVMADLSTASEEEEMARAVKRIREGVRAEKVKSEDAPAGEKAEKKSGWSLAKRKIIMWASVAGIAFAVFVIWASVIKNNFSFDWGAKSYTVFREASGNWQETETLLDELSQERVDIEKAMNQGQTAESGSNEVVDKLKEKILVDELKNKLEE